MSDELKPCPFCGSRCVNDTTPPPDMDGLQNPTYYWVCPDCVCCGPICESVEEATKAWNNRGVPKCFPDCPEDMDLNDFMAELMSAVNSEDKPH